MPPQDAHDRQTVSLKDLFFQVVDERDRRYEQRFDGIDKSLDDAVRAVKEALASANSGTDKALNSANTAIAVAMSASEKAREKAELAADKRFDAVNEFRGQLADQQITFVRKSEVDIRFVALEEKLDLAFAQLQISRGRETGVSAVWAGLGVVAAILLSAAGLIVTLMRN